MPTEAPMQHLIDDHEGTHWYVADKSFDNPGVYFWDGKQNVHARDEIATLVEQNRILKEALRMYARPDHWMTPTSDADSPRTIWVARTHFDRSPNGNSTAYHALMKVAANPTQAELRAFEEEFGRPFA